jgi:dihydrodipicolinate synthase/N-acetylneuraminate lyase
MLPKGLICPLLVPFKKDGEIDALALKQLWGYVKPFVAGMAVGSSFSFEGIYLNSEQKKVLFKFILELWEGDIPLYFDITSSDEVSMLELANFTADLLGSHLDKIAMEVLPLWVRGNRGLPQYIEHLYAQTGAPFLLANHPRLVRIRKVVLKHSNIRTSVFKKLVHYDFIKGIIFQGELRRFLNYHRALGRRSHFYFYEADELNFLKQPTNDGVIAITANVVPEIWHKLVRVALHLDNKNGNKNEENLREIFALRQTIKELHLLSHEHPAILKWALKELGILFEDATIFPGEIKRDGFSALRAWLYKYKKSG